MTTIAFRNGILAADSLMTDGDTRFPAPVDKVFRFEKKLHTYLVAGCGDYAKISSWIRIFQKDLDKSSKGDMGCPRLVASAGMTMAVVHYDEHDQLTIWEVGESGTCRIDLSRVPYYAIGSGCDFAWGALGAGCSAMEAVRIATAFDINSGGDVLAFSVLDEEPLREAGSYKMPRFGGELREPCAADMDQTLSEAA